MNETKQLDFLINLIESLTQDKLVEYEDIDN